MATYLITVMMIIFIEKFYVTGTTLRGCGVLTL